MHFENYFFFFNITKKIDFKKWEKLKNKTKFFLVYS